MSRDEDRAVPTGEEKPDQAVSVKKGKSKTKKSSLTINLTNCSYDSVRRVARRFGLRPVGDDEEWTVYWIDTSVIIDRVMNMKRYQKINHFPGMAEICRKDFLARNMNRMFKVFPSEYNCFPKSWCMPADYGDFKAHCRAHKNKTYITKPDSGSQGKGIIVFKNPKQIHAGEHSVVQQYISKPFIIDGFKFDLRIYVVVTSCDPFRIYVYKDGLARFATVTYHEPTTSNISKQCMHLTNYAINKHSADFIRDDDSGSKRRITTVNQWFIDNGYDLGKIWHDIDDVIIKTLISAHHILKHNYRSCFPNHNTGSACFEILGFDVLLDSNLKPWLIEVNHSPSFHTDAPLDKEVKEGLLYDTFNLIDLYANDKRKCDEQDKRKVKDRLLLRQKAKDSSHTADGDSRAKYEAHLETFEKTHSGGLRRIYPNGNEDYYAPFFKQSSSLCAETTASKKRVELSRQQRASIEAKQKEVDLFKKKLAPAGGAGRSKGDSELKPESPINDRKPTKPAAIKFKPSFRPSRSTEVSTPIVPYGNGVNPQTIKDEDELERLASLQLRESLIRRLGVSEQFRAALVSETTPTETRVPSVLSHDSSTTPKCLFFTNSCYQNHGPGINIPQTDSFLPAYLTNIPYVSSTSASPIHSLPGAFSLHRRLNNGNSKASSAYFQCFLPPRCPRGSHNTSVKSLSADYNRPSLTVGDRPSQLPQHPHFTLNQTRKKPPSLNVRSEVFDLSIKSSPISLSIRKQFSNVVSQRPNIQVSSHGHEGYGEAYDLHSLQRGAKRAFKIGHLWQKT